MIRITAGRFKGRRLELAPASRVRPSTAKLREALFSALGRRLDGAVVADLFAGSGALGLEALSRGARRVVLVEIDAKAVKVLWSNLKSLGVGPEEAVVRRADSHRWLEKLARGEIDAAESPDILIMDPPYGAEALPRLLPILARLLESGAIDLCAMEHESELAEELELPPSIVARGRRHGRSSYRLLERAES